MAGKPVGLVGSSSAPMLGMSTRPQHVNSGPPSFGPRHPTATGFTPSGSQMAVIQPFRPSPVTSDDVSMSAVYSHAATPQHTYNCPPNAPSNQRMQKAVHPLAEHLLRIDPTPRPTGHDADSEDNELNIMTSIFSLCDMELHDIITWAKSIPGYTELDLVDRIHLLECCWMEILLIGLIWRSMSKNEVLYLSPDLQLTRDRLAKAKFVLIGSQILACVKQFEKLRLKHEEFVLLRCAILLNSDLVKLHSAEKVETLKCRIIDALQYTVLEQHGGDIGRLSQLLMLLPHVRQVAMQTIQHFLSLSAHCILPKFALLKEMVEAFVKVLGMPMVEDIEMAHSPAAPLPPPASPTSTLN